MQNIIVGNKNSYFSKNDSSSCQSRDLTNWFDAFVPAFLVLSNNS